MRIKAMLVAGAVGAGLVATAGSASAICMEVPVLGCVSVCDEAGKAYRTADKTALDKLPDRQWNCPR